MSPVTIRPAVRAARNAGRGIVALESTVISHGLPFPQNLETARAMEDAVLAEGSEPATVGVVSGELVVGLDADEIEVFARDDQVAKVSRRDLAAVAARGGLGATTVAGTIIAAARAGISVMVTGGIGGVHRGGASSLDISADLTELGRTPVAVVCAGAKSILDLGRTMEVLETQGVPVVGYRTARMPGFYVRDTGLPVDHRVDSPTEAASLVAAQAAFALGGMLIVQPPSRETALPTAQVEEWIQAAEAEAAREGVHGKHLTPFLLAALGRASGNQTLATNIDLLIANARLAGAIAREIATRPVVDDPLGQCPPVPQEGCG